MVCTGGEPLLQLDAPLLAAFHARAFEVAVETNGTRPAVPGIDWLCVSPKAGAPLLLRAGHELKLVFPQAGLGPADLECLDFTRFYLQPMDGPDLGAQHAGGPALLPGAPALAAEPPDPQAAGHPVTPTPTTAPTTVLILSGGLDSTVLLYHLRAEGHTVKALSVDYGQRHARELDYARATCRRLGVEHRVADLTALAPLLASSALVDPAVAIPNGEYARDNMRLTVVPNRNMIMLAVAAAWAIGEKADSVSFAAHHGYHTLYPDCTPQFIESMARSIRLADWHPVRLVAPFARQTKADIVRRGVELGVPFEQTWSCYEGGEAHCGRCGTCRERAEAFAAAGVPDPTRYAAGGAGA